MPSYRLKVKTGTDRYAGTDSAVHCSLVGERGRSHRTHLAHWLWDDMEEGTEHEYVVESDVDLGEVWMVELEVSASSVPDYLILGRDYWFCCRVTVETPGRDQLHFPCYRWLDACTVRLRSSDAKLAADDSVPALSNHRQEEVLERQSLHRWRLNTHDLPSCIDFQTVDDLPLDLKFNQVKRGDFQESVIRALGEMQLKKFVNIPKRSWESLEEFDRIFWNVDNPIAVYVKQHWKEDWIFGYQFLNGMNPVLIRRCGKIPDNFPVTEAMVRSSLGNATLQQTLQKGSLYIVDYKLLDGLEGNIINEEQQYLAAPMCLLHLDQCQRIMPLAIQLKQKPGLDNPIFLPTDSSLDWLQAKMWVRCADMNFHSLVTHLLMTHLMAETFFVATMRQLPAVHPVYKLLIPHFRYTVQINVQAREDLVGEGAILSRLLAIGPKGRLLLPQRAFKDLTYSSLCLRDNLDQRGVTDLEKYYYKDDGLLVWGAIERFVIKVVDVYYRGDERVRCDLELQAWIADLTQGGLHHLKGGSGMPTAFRNRAELSKFLTMVVFTCSGQHAAVNNGQYDWAAWVPNTPSTMRRPPPTAKGVLTMEDIMDTVPSLSQSSLQMAIAWSLSQQSEGMRSLGTYPEEHFSEERVRSIIGEFQAELRHIEHEIHKRNDGLELKYEYLLPSTIENSITI